MESPRSSLTQLAVIKCHAEAETGSCAGQKYLTWKSQRWLGILISVLLGCSCVSCVGASLAFVSIAALCSDNTSTSLLHLPVGEHFVFF